MENKTKKMKLDELKLQSFITNADGKDAKTLKGGIFTAWGSAKSNCGDDCDYKETYNIESC